MTTIQNELSLAERAELRQLETTISRGWQTFIQVGEALSQINEKRLYREDFRTFEEYCQKVWNWSRNRAYQMMDAAKTASVLAEVGVTVTHEREARRLKPVAQAVAAAPAEKKPQVMQEAIEKAMQQTMASAVTPPSLPAPAASRPKVALYIHGTGDGKWQGMYYIGSTRYPLRGHLTLSELEQLIDERLADEAPCTTTEERI